MRLIARFAQSWALEKGCSRLGAKPASLDFGAYLTVAAPAAALCFQKGQSLFRHPGGQFVFGGFGMVIWRALVLGILEQTSRNSGGPRFMCYIHNDHHYFSIHAGWLGCVCRRLSSNGWKCCFPHEGRGSFCGIILFAEAGCNEGVTFGVGQGILTPL